MQEIARQVISATSTVGTGAIGPMPRRTIAMPTPEMA
jgi:hypothetical protein